MNKKESEMNEKESEMNEIFENEKKWIKMTEEEKKEAEAVVNRELAVTDILLVIAENLEIDEEADVVLKRELGEYDEEAIMEAAIRIYEVAKKEMKELV